MLVLFPNFIFFFLASLFGNSLIIKLGKKGSENNLTSSINSTRSLVGAFTGVKNMINGGSTNELNTQSQKLQKTLSGIMQKFR